MRGPGDILGTRQSGVPGFILGNLFEDTKIINQSRIDANEIIENKDKVDNKNLINLIEIENNTSIGYMD